MYILSIALGGCLRGEPVQYGITEDTGGHITYILGEMRALARHPRVERTEIITRLFDDPALGEIHSQRYEELEPDCVITRLDTGDRRYLAKEELMADRLPFIRTLLAELRSRERLPDLIHAHFADAADVAAHVQRELGIPFIYTAHSLGMDKLEAVGEPCDPLETRIEEEDRAIGNAAAIIGSSRDECERQLLAYPSAIASKINRVIPGVSINTPTEAAISGAEDLIAPFLTDPSKPIVLAIARPVKKKNLSALVEAFAPIKDRANLVILAGQRSSTDEGETEQVEVMTELLHLIDRHNLYGSVAYPKSHTSEDVAGLYTLAVQSRGVFVNPALVEPYGLTILEAAAYGLPVVATRNGGPVDTISELQHGAIVDPRSPALIGAEIENMLDDRERWDRHSANGLNNSRSLTWDNYASHFVSIAQDLLDKPFAAQARTGPSVSSLFVSDLDNTLTGCASGVERLRAFLSARPDFAFAIATGRSMIEARRIVREWEIPTPAAWITSVGSEIYWSASEGCARDRTFPSLAKVRWRPAVVDEVMEQFPSIEPQPCYEQREFKRSYFFSDEADIERVRSALRQAGQPVRVIASHDRLLDTLPVSAGKAAAMQHVAAVLGIERSNVFAAGDSGNDEDMLMECENAIIVENHAREIAKLTSRPNVYLSTRPRGEGAVEGIEAHHARRGYRAADVAKGKAL